MPDHSSKPLPVAGDQAILARRYVSALYELAEQESHLDAIAADVRSLIHLWDESAEWRFVATDPRIAKEGTAAAVAQVAKSANLNKLTTNFLSIIAQNGRLFLLPDVLTGFLCELALRRGEHYADVCAARPLSATQRDALATALSAVAGGKVHMNITEDASILGGLTVKLGSQFIDASVKTKLDHLERALKGAA